MTFWTNILDWRKPCIDLIPIQIAHTLTWREASVANLTFNSGSGITAASNFFSSLVQIKFYGYRQKEFPHHHYHCLTLQAKWIHTGREAPKWGLFFLQQNSLTVSRVRKAERDKEWRENRCVSNLSNKKTKDGCSSSLFFPLTANFLGLPWFGSTGKLFGWRTCIGQLAA